MNRTPQHADALGSVVAVTDENGAVVERREYEPHGAQLTSALQNGPGYTGHVRDAATGLTYMQQRYYDPQIGRMLSRDPVTAYSSGDMRSFNGYAYANNNPYHFTDPDERIPGETIGIWPMWRWMPRVPIPISAKEVLAPASLIRSGCC
ncbi:RHS repeat-associated core domain-containing protein [Luteimonas sp. TWI662]|uniref:RHS repeat domain-containing protein n=1 Tax=Luteimonas sp. TWI662 TaxID=3136789 RepID=UPI003207ED59